MGVEEHKKSAPKGFRFGVITVSDKGSRGKRKDEAGPLIIKELSELGENVYYKIVPDDKIEILVAIAEAIKSGAEVIVTTGGTGITSSDVTIETVTPLFDKELEFGEIFRYKSYEEIGYAAILTRATGGVIRGRERSVVIFSLPGSVNAVETGLEIIKSEVFHVLKHALE
ncbi:MogA/MoaB family molybdenum cofactor biosynthesis protein [Pyrococcus abyssi]|uniref:Molybdenum cofactor biosynthesis protein n=1 Tax=Pyrococcus abyssi (strain GE5 / Orsay) TaxID=272844 RepID=Q9UYI0_PYRAB|nr:molybdenum cofactor biosynthesis protein B [Pyrococcus abyssi]CAB50432.1 moaB-2 molybdenum cofactor biosynthesis protein [Pyrococcus abyssi GE5]CCE70981.1 TPA: molybdenum cofactor biosynthesis protein [Pyrococcus abyssi GE5]